MLLACCIGMFIFAFSASSKVEPELPQPVAKKYFKQWLKESKPPPPISSQLKWWPYLKNIYRQNGYNLIWINGFQLNRSGELLRTLVWETIADEQIKPEYHYKIIESKLKAQDHHPQALTALDLILTDAFLSFAKDSLSGKLTPDRDDAAHNHLSKVKIKLKQQYEVHQLDVLAVLDEYLNQNNIGQFLQYLFPQHQGYLQMREALAHYLRLSIDHKWLPIPSGPTLSLGQRHEQIFLIRRRLVLLGDLDQELPQEPKSHSSPSLSYIHNTQNDQYQKELQNIEAQLVQIDPLQHSVYLYDYEMQQAVKLFQTRHGLEPTGKVDAKTRTLLNTPIKDRAQQLALNMKRWRHLPPELGERYIFVNMANFDLAYIENGMKVADMKVIIGKPYRRTPIMSGKIDTVVINPYWNVPYRIAVKDILPKVRKDPSYLQSHNLQVLPNWDDEMAPVDTSEIDWNTISTRPFKYRFRQPPGPDNSLGNVKFLFPNDYSIFLHDTPKRDLFNESKRALSSGCIRVEKPLLLAKHILGKQQSWNEQAINERVGQRKNTYIRLNDPVPVYLMYWTAWVSKDGQVQFRDDIYGRDKKPLLQRTMEASRGQQTLSI